MRDMVLNDVEFEDAGDCPAGGKHHFSWQDTGDSGQVPYRFVACDECGASPRRVQHSVGSARPSSYEQGPNDPF